MARRRWPSGGRTTVLAEVRLDEGRLDLAAETAERAAAVHTETGYRLGLEAALAIGERAAPSRAGR